MEHDGTIFNHIYTDPKQYDRLSHQQLGCLFFGDMAPVVIKRVVVLVDVAVIVE